MASGNTLLEWVPQSGEPTAADYGTHDKTAQQHPVIDLALTEEIRLSGVMPRHYAGTTGVTFYLHYAMSSAIANDINLETSIERIGDQVQNIHTGEGFAAAETTGDITVPGTAGLVDIVPTTHLDGAEMDSLAVGEGFRLNIQRVAVAGTDAAGDLELRFVEMKET